MTSSQLIQIRLSNQRLASTEFDDPVDVVSLFGAVQAQDYGMSKWALALRLKNASHEHIEEQVNAAKIIRTHLFRGTWHFVAMQDVRWMLDIAAPYIKKVAQYIDKQSGLTDEFFKKAWKVLEPELQSADNLTKEEITSRLAKKKMKIGGFLATQFLIRAELEQRICNGVREKHKTTYSLFDKRIRASKKISREEALSTLARRYFTSRGPATAKDFMWWTGFNQADSTIALATLENELQRLHFKGLTYLYFDTSPVKQKKTSALLPCYDEFMVGYAEGRDIALPPGIDRTLLGNGIFKPLILYNNKIAGSWRKISKAPFVELEFLQYNDQAKAFTSKLKSFNMFSGR